MSHKKTIIVDIDGCMNSLNDTIDMVRAEEGLGPLPMPLTWALEEFSPEDRKYVLEHYADPAFMSRALPKPEAPSALWRLYMNYDIVLLTARAIDLGTGQLKPEMVKVTEEWLSGLRLPPYKLVHALTKDKGAEARRLYGDNIAFAIEDSPSSLGSYLAHGIKTFAITYPYNQQFIGEKDVQYVHDFDDIVNRLEMWRHLEPHTLTFEYERVSA